MTKIREIAMGGGKTLSYLLSSEGTRAVASAIAALFAFAAAAKAAVALAVVFCAATTAEAADYDLNGATVSITTQDALSSDPYKGKTIKNGTLNVSANQQFANGTITFGSGLVLNQTAGAWQTSGGRTVKVENGGVVNYTSTTDIYIGRLSNGTSYNGTTELALDKGTFNSSAALKLTSKASNDGNNKTPTLKLTLSNNSSLTLPSDKNITIGGIEQANSQKHNTLNCVVNVTSSSITANQFTIGQMKSYLKTPGSSANTITFGSGSDLTMYHQMYAYLYPQPTVKFNGATIHYAGASGSKSFIGQNTAVTTDIYEIQSGGLTIDIPSGVSLTIDGNSSALKGAGGITKTGAGSITWNNVTGSSPTKKMTFTGPFVVSNGTWTSTLGYAASAFRAEGGNLTLSGALSASSVALSATDGGVLTLAGATLTDASPDLTLATGGSTDYFTRDGAVAAYTLATFTLGAGGILSLDANATEIDAISAATTNVTATVANPAAITVNFLVAPVTGQTFTLFETDDAAKFTVNPKLGNVILPHETSVVNGVLTLTITADDYTWNGTGTNWGDAGAWTKGGAAVTWADGNNAIFNTANATATLAADASPAKIEFTANATVGGSATLTVPEVSVVSDVAATISAPTAGELTKTGAGTLALGANRTEQTTVTEGTLKVLSGATVDPAKLTLGTDAAKPVTFDYGGQTLTANPATYVGGGMNVTLANGSYEYSNTYALDADSGNFPSVLTVGPGATVQATAFNWNTRGGSGTIKVVGGAMKSTASDSNNWIMQKSLTGSLDINVTDGGLLEFGGETYMLTCRDEVGGSTAYESPKVNMKVVDSTLRVLNNKNIRFGLDDNMKPTATPEFALAATNSVFDIAYGLYIGNNPAEGRATEGFYKTDFENCVITAKQFRVYNGRPLNSARLNNSQIVFNAAGEITAYDDDAKWITVDAGGLTIDNQSFRIDLNANLGGSGTVTKVGTGKLSINTNQTATAALVCEEGETYVQGGVSVARAITVKNGAKVTAAGTAQIAVSNIAFEAGAELRVDIYTLGVTPIAVETMTLPASGTVSLTKGHGAFTKGLYPILTRTGVTVAEVEGKLVPTLDAGATAYQYVVKGDTLYLAVDTDLSGFVWTGAAGDGKMSTTGNWWNGSAPGEGDAVDFAGVTVTTTIEADIDATFGAVTMGPGIVLFTGDKMRATSFSDMTKVSVGTDATVTLVGDLMFSGSGLNYVIYRVNRGGKFIVTGKVGLASGASGNLQAQDNPGTGIIVAGNLVNDSTDQWIYVARDGNSTKQKWAIGPSGISGTATSVGMWVYSNNNVNPEFQPNTNDFTVSLWTVLRENAKSFTYNTTGLDGLGHTITLDAGFSDKTAPLYVTGTGKVVVNHVTKSFGDKNAYSGPVTVTDTATLAINAGKKLTSGAITMNTGTTLEVAQSGTNAVGNLTLKDGATLKFNFTERKVAPVLDLEGKTVTFGDLTNINVSVNGTVRPAYGSDGKYFLTAGGNFKWIGENKETVMAVVAKTEDCANWVKEVGVDEATGNIYACVDQVGLCILFR